MSVGIAAGLARLAPLLIGTRSKQRLTILIYHRVLPEADYLRPTEPTVVEFDLQMMLLAKCFNPLSLNIGLQLMRSGELPERAVCVTFDDGYADNAELALPVLQRWGIPATVFIATGFLNGGQMWNDTVIESIRSRKDPVLDLSAIGLETYLAQSASRRFETVQSILRAIKHWEPGRRTDAVEYIASISPHSNSSLMLTDEQLIQLHSSGVEIGAHTVNHPILAAISESNARDEIGQSKDELETKLDSPVKFFAYPNGVPDRDYSQVHCRAVKELGFEAALSTQWGAAYSQSDIWQLPRFTPWDRTALRFTSRLLLNYRNPK